MNKLLKLFGCNYNPWTGESLYPAELEVGAWGTITKAQILSEDDLLDILAAEIMRNSEETTLTSTQSVYSYKNRMN